MMPVVSANAISFPRNDSRPSPNKRSVDTVASGSEIVREVKQSRADIQSAPPDGLQTHIELHFRVLQDQLKHSANSHKPRTVSHREHGCTLERPQYLPSRLVVGPIHQQDAASPRVGNRLNPEDDGSRPDGLAHRYVPYSAEIVAFEAGADRQFPVVGFPGNVGPVDQTDKVQ